MAHFSLDRGRGQEQEPVRSNEVEGRRFKIVALTVASAGLQSSAVRPTKVDYFTDLLATSNVRT